MKKATALLLLLLLLLPLVLSACKDIEGSLGIVTTSAETNDNGVTTNDGLSDYIELLSSDETLRVDITIESGNYASLTAVPSADTYYPAIVNIDGNISTTAGIKIKGNTDYVDEANGKRYSFKLKFDEYMKGSKLLGLDELCLNNMIYDPSFVRELLTYRLLAEIGANAPLASFAAVYINDEYIGLYTAVEAIDNSYLKRVFGDNNENLYKAMKDCTLLPGSESCIELKKGDDTALSEITALISMLDRGEDISGAVDVSSILKYIAANAVIGNVDSYLGKKAQNFYLYAQAGRLKMIPWDYNLAFGTDTTVRKTEYVIDKTLITADVKNPYFDTAPENRPLIASLLKNQAYFDEYLSYVKKISEFLDQAPVQMNQYKELISSYVESDPTKFYSYNDFLSEFDPSNENSLSYFIKARNEFVKTQLDSAQKSN